MGGYMAYAWASLQPQRFAAIAPVSGAWDPAYADPQLYEWLLEHRRGGGAR
jgi:predicted peptidase